jgi:hypothetical protein
MKNEKGVCGVGSPYSIQKSELYTNELHSKIWWRYESTVQTYIP